MKTNLIESFSEIERRIIELQQLYPALTFNNDGYEYLSKKIKDEHSKQIDEISSLIKKIDPSFVKFFNFKPRENGLFAIRYACRYDNSFIGLNYIEIEE